MNKFLAGKMSGAYKQAALMLPCRIARGVEANRCMDFR